METNQQLTIESADAQLTVRLKTNDGLEGLFTIELQKGMRRQNAIQWPLGVSDNPTAEVRLEREQTGDQPSLQVISGDLWRDLESHDLDDEFLDRVLRGADAQVAAADLLGMTIPFGSTHALVYRVGSEHGFDDYDVVGHPLVHRITVGHGIKKGENFNIYCQEARKVGGKWDGSLVSSLSSALQMLTSESAA